MKIEISKQKQNRVAIQGAPGSFHEQAGMKYFGDTIQCIECVTFKDVFNNVANGKADFGIAAIENTVAGTILPNYAILRQSEVKIIGEVYLHIQQNLLALPGQVIENIKEVHSHPMAILQCQAFFENYPRIKLIEADDTASRARWISEKKLRYIGAIAGTYAAELYHLQLLAQGIETHKKNFTRFLVISKNHANEINSQFSFYKKGREHVTPDKSSICFNVRHQQGSLAQVLTKLADHGVNLTKIQSLPLVAKEWEYYIHLDMEFESYENYKNALSAIMPSLKEFKILGEYKRGKKNNVQLSN